LATIFLDRDGTLNVDTAYLVDPAGMVLIEGASAAVASFKSLGLDVVIVTNQSAIARGMGTREQVEATNQKLVDLLNEEVKGAAVDAIFYCPHGPEDDCSCRKPKTGMLGNFVKTIEPTLDQCWMVGDKISDLKFGLELGLKASHCVLVRTGEGATEEGKLDCLGAASLEIVVVDSIKNVASLIEA